MAKRRPARGATRAENDKKRAERAGRAFARLVQLMATLRSARGCPWDREQTPSTLRPFLLEETYEALDALDRGDHDALRDELGDVLFQCVFQAQIAAEARRFEIAESVDAISAKLIRRHPHVFTPDGRPLSPAHQGRTLKSPTRVLEQWEQIKAREQQSAGQKPRLLAGVPRSLPALLRAHEIGTRVAAVGFDWPSAPEVMDKVDEELRELREALDEHPGRAAEEFGDLLFSLANLARKLGLESESALREANEKFTGRFTALEAIVESTGRRLQDLSAAELDEVWQRVKAVRPRAAPASAPRSSGNGRGPSGRRPSRRPSRG